MPFKQVGSGVALYSGTLNKSAYFAADRRATRPFLHVLSLQDRSRVSRIDFRRWAVITVTDEQPPCWTMEIRALVRDNSVVHANVETVPPAPDGVCIDTVGPVRLYEIVKVRKAILDRPLPHIVVLDSLTPPVTRATSSGGSVALAYGSYCWFGFGVGLCSDRSYDTFPTLRIVPGETVRFSLGFEPSSLTLVLRYGAPGEQAVPLPLSSLAEWRVPEGFTTPPDGVHAIIRALGGRGDVDYLAGFLSVSP
jgi:hypothetical protein